MFKKAALIAAAATSAFIAMPAAAEAQGYYGSRYDRGYNQNQGQNYGTDRYGRTYTYDRYGNRIFVNTRRYAGNNGYYGGNNGGYYSRNNGGHYANNGGYYGRPVYNQGYSNDGYRRCSNGTTGTIVGGAVGALLGREVARGGNRNYGYGYSRGGSGTTGAIIGGAVGALAGRAIANGGCR